MELLSVLQIGFLHTYVSSASSLERRWHSKLSLMIWYGVSAESSAMIEAHRPERVEPAFEASLERLGLNYPDLYLIHTPFPFQPGDEQDPRDQNGNVL